MRVGTWHPDTRQPLLKRPDTAFSGISLRRAAQYGLVVGAAAFWLSVLFWGPW
jgi:hypothetical protein